MNTPGTPRLTRRTFLQAGSTAAVAAPLLGPRLLVPSPNETLNVAHVGVGGMGSGDLGNVSQGKLVRIVGLCDVDARHLDAAAKRHPKAKSYRDFRKMFAELDKSVDAVVVSTPDHMHGPVAIAALGMGKHVYCQKPIAHNLFECRRMAELATAKRLVTQMGTQIHNHTHYLSFVATLQTGVIGKVRQAFCWVGKSWAGPAKGRPDKKDPVPDHLDWDLWLGVAPERPFVNRLYHPANWRGWLDFGSGTLGDMGCHIFDPVFSALQLGAPRSVISKGDQHHPETFAGNSDIHYEFPGTPRTTETFRLRWTDGARSRPQEAKQHLPDEAKLPGAGSLLVGEKGVMVIPHWNTPEVYLDRKATPDAVVKVPGKNHYHEWTDACRGEGTASTPFSYSGPLTEAVLLGTVAGRFRDAQFAWDIDGLKFGDPRADALVKRSYRKGWEIGA